jgi:hypothetical protein
MNPLRTNAGHQLRFLGKRPRFLKQQVGIPFCRMMAAEQWRDACFQLQPVLNGREFNSGVRTEACSAVVETPTSGCAEFDDGHRVFIGRLRERHFRTEE